MKHKDTKEEYLLNKDDLDMLLNEFGNALMNKQAFGEVQKSSNGVAQFAMDFLNEKLYGER